MRRALWISLAAAGAIACGPPKATDRCDQPNRFLCADKDTALECRTATGGELQWAEIPCRGAGGCVKDGEAIRCDVDDAQEGDGCASTAEGDGLCSGTDLLTCVRGTMVRTSCSSCSVSNGQIVCQP